MPQLLKKPSRPVCAIPQRGSSDPMPNPMGFIWETLMIPVCDYWKHRRCFHRRSGYLDNLGPGVLQKFASNCASLFATVNKLFLVCCCWYDLPDSLCKPGCPLWQQQKQPKGGGTGTDRQNQKLKKTVWSPGMCFHCWLHSGMTGWWDSRNKAHTQIWRKHQVTTRLEFTRVTKQMWPFPFIGLQNSNPTCRDVPAHVS